MLAMRDLMEMLQIKAPALRDEPHHPVDHPLMVTDRNIFHVIRDTGSILLHHPYESFATSVERFLREASADPKVRAIKMTIYRTSEDARIISYLIDAARNGKQVAVVVELKARFDEEANIRWAKRLEDVGIHVTYGVVGLKTHCKAILVVRHDYDGLRRYAHVGTGNYHSGHRAALLRPRPPHLRRGHRPRPDRALQLPHDRLQAATRLPQAPARAEDHEARDAREDRARDRHTVRKGHIQLKANALDDLDVIRALYAASQAGVRVELIVRDSCRLRPGCPGLSENIRVVSIVGRFLEHARIYYFRNGGEEEYYIGSADAMKRNLENRVEILAPVGAPELRADLRHVLDLQLGDRRGGWEMRADGSYVQADTSVEGARVRRSASGSLYRSACARPPASRRRKPRGIVGRNLK